MNYLLIPILLPPAVEDIRTRRISNIYFIIIILLRCTILFIKKDAEGLSSGLLAVLFTSVMFALSYVVSKDGIGLGDVKLMLAVSYYLGLYDWMRALLFISVFSLASSLFLLVMKKVKKDTSLPFAPFILAGTAASVLFGVIK